MFIKSHSRTGRGKRTNSRGAVVCYRAQTYTNYLFAVALSLLYIYLFASHAKYCTASVNESRSSVHGPSGHVLHILFVQTSSSEVFLLLLKLPNRLFKPSPTRRPVVLLLRTWSSDGE